MTGADAMDVDRYLGRIGLEPGEVRSQSLDSLTTIQRAHVESVPFETLAITGHPWHDALGEGVILEQAELFQKVVEEHRGGFCYELNGLCNWLLADLGFDVDQVVGAVLTDGEPCPPANHLTTIVTLDRRYLVDVGLGVPPMRQPLPLTGSVREDRTGVAWRATESSRPDADYLTQYRVGDGEWVDRYVIRTVPRELSYVEATCEYLTTAPESPFTGDPVVTIGTADGYAKLTPDTLTRFADGDEHNREVTPTEWDDLLDETFGLRVSRG